MRYCIVLILGIFLLVQDGHAQSKLSPKWEELTAGDFKEAIGKARGIPDAIRKAEESARKAMFRVPMIGATIPHEITATSGTATVMLRPAAPGTGVKAGGAVRACLEACGIHNVLAKSPPSPRAPARPGWSFNRCE